MPVAVEGHRLAVALKISAGRGEVVERRFALHEAQLHQATGRVVDVNQQRAAGTALLEPGVLGAVDLNQFAEALAPVARLMRHPDSLSPRDPDASADQPDPQRFLGDPEIVQLEELLAGQRGTEVGVALAHDLDGLRSQLVWQAPIARLAAFARDEARRPSLLEDRAQSTHLALGEADELCRLRLREPSLEDLPDDGETVQLPAAHLDQLLGHQSAFQATPRRRKRTFLLGPKRTFSFGCYNRRSDKKDYVNSTGTPYAIAGAKRPGLAPGSAR